MVIDIHTHTFPGHISAQTLQKLQNASRTQPFTDGTNNGLTTSMSAAGVDLSVLLPVATNPKQVSRINDNAAALNERTGETGLFSFGCIHPELDDIRGELSRIVSLGLKGIKLHPAYQSVAFDDPKYLRILDRCGELGLIVLTHAGIDIGLPEPVYCSPSIVLHALQEVGPLPLILAHMGGWRQWDEVEKLLADTPVYLDTAFSFGQITPLPGTQWTDQEKVMMQESQFLRFVKKFGANRILFGTDSPWGDQSTDLHLIRSLPLPEAQKNSILGENARLLLKLS